MNYFKQKLVDAKDAVSNAANNAVQAVSKTIYSPPTTDQFEINGQLSPQQFMKAGDKLVQVCKGWTWKPSANPNYKSKYLDDHRQYLALDQCICSKRIGAIITGTEENVKTEDGDQVTILHSAETKQEEKEQVRYYYLKIIYDEHYYTPRMFFSATDTDFNPLSNQLIKQDITREYLDKTLTMQPFPFIQNVNYPTVHPCKHAVVLKSMSDTMRQNGIVVKSHFALLIFLKFITSVIPTVDFDMTGELIFQ